MYVVVQGCDKFWAKSSEGSTHKENDGNGRTVFNLMKDFRFALVMENKNFDGYVSEKIASAFLDSTVPIYYGTADIFKKFNRKAFIYYDVKNPSPALERIEYLEKNHSAYRECLAEPVLANGEKTLEEFFSLSDEIGGGKLKKRILDMMSMPS